MLGWKECLGGMNAWMGGRPRRKECLEGRNAWMEGRPRRKECLERMPRRKEGLMSFGGAGVVRIIVVTRVQQNKRTIKRPFFLFLSCSCSPLRLSAVG